MIKLTARQQEVLDCIRNAIRETGFPPTRKDIAKELGFRSANAAEDHLKALARKGVIEIVSGTSRGIRLLNEEEEPQDGLPIVGRVAAGSPILAEQHIERYAEVPPHMFAPSADFLLRVHGESMIDAGIFDEDLVAVKNTQQAQNGQIIVARIDDEVTVKRFQKTNREILLIAENEAYEPIRVTADSGDFAIEGLVVGVIRDRM
ncbi:MAG: transcriptional repressor LexA [Pseudomonadales bacterium]|jgi:repressor LexA